MAAMTGTNAVAWAVGSTAAKSTLPLWARLHLRRDDAPGSLCARSSARSLVAVPPPSPSPRRATR